MKHRILALGLSLAAIAMFAVATPALVQAAGSGYIHGVVRDAATATGASNIDVFLSRLDTSDPAHPQWVASGQEYTGPQYAPSSYAFTQLAAGTYRLEFFDPAGIYAPQYWNNAFSEGTATSIDLPEGGNASADVQLVKAGHIVGKVTNAASKPLAGIWVSAASADLSAYDLPSTASTTAADGSYDIGGLNSGNWVLECDDPSGVYQYQFWPGKLIFGAGTPIAVTAGAETTLNVSMQLPATIARVSPVSGMRGAKVTITGARFGASRAGGNVLFGKKAATSYLKWSATKIVCKVPRSARKGRLSVIVQTRSSISKGKTFRVL